MTIEKNRPWAKHIMGRPSSLLLIVMLSMLFSCSMDISATSYQDRSIPPVPLPTDSNSSLWESSDLSIAVECIRRQDRATFTGKLAFDSSILMSFPVVERFSLALLLQDANGVVLGREPLHLGIVHYKFAEESYTFTLQTSLPENAGAYTFEYAGSFSDYGERNPDSIYIAYHPPEPSSKPAE